MWISSKKVKALIQEINDLNKLNGDIKEYADNVFKYAKDATEHVNTSVEFFDSHLALVKQIHDTQDMLTAIFSAIKNNMDPIKYSELMKAYVEYLKQIRGSDDTVRHIQEDVAEYVASIDAQGKIERTDELSDVFDSLFHVDPGVEEDKPVVEEKPIVPERCIVATEKYADGSSMEVYSDGVRVERKINNGFVTEQTTYPNGYVEEETKIEA